MNFKHSLAYLSFAVLLFSCSNEKNKSDSESKELLNKPDTLAYENNETEVVPNPSDIHFDNAITLFNEKKFNEASQEILEGSACLKKEARETSKEIIRNNKHVTKYLNALASDVKDGKVKSAEELEEAFEKAEFKVAHNFFLESEIYISGNNYNYDSVFIPLKKGGDYLSASAKYGKKEKDRFQQLGERARQLTTEFKKNRKEISADLKDQFKQFIVDLRKMDSLLEGPVPE